MPVIYIDADACPVKEETYRVGRRYGLKIRVVANAGLFVPTDKLIELTVVSAGDFDAADNHIVMAVEASDIVITADIPLAARCLEKAAFVLDPKGQAFNVKTIGDLLGTRELMDGLRKMGAVTGGPAPMTAKDRSRFLSKLDEVVNAALRKGEGQ